MLKLFGLKEKFRTLVALKDRPSLWVLPDFYQMSSACAKMGTPLYPGTTYEPSTKTLIYSQDEMTIIVSITNDNLYSRKVIVRGITVYDNQWLHTEPKELLMYIQTRLNALGKYHKDDFYNIKIKYNNFLKEQVNPKRKKQEETRENENLELKRPFL